MAILFHDDFLDEFGTWPLGYIPYGGADFGEVAAVAAAVGEGDAGAFYAAWIAAGDRLAAGAQAAEKLGAKASARELFLRASVFYSVSYRPLFGAPVDPRLLAAFRKQIDALDRGFALFGPPVLPQTIPFEGAAMPAYFLPAPGLAAERRPTIIFTNGYDATVTDMLFASALAAGRRGYHAILFDGPGQGAMLYEQNVPLRPDWEAVVAPVVDFALSLPQVDPQKIALSGWSLGGYLAPRAASGEHRLAACMADPGQWAIADSFRAIARMMGAPEAAAADLGSVPEPLLKAFSAMIAGDRSSELEDRPARLLGQWRERSPRLSADDRAFHPGGTRRRHPLPDAAHRRRERSLGQGGSEALRRAEMPEDAHQVHRRRGGRRPLRDDEPLPRQSNRARLARPDAAGRVRSDPKV